jgi:hypothetical protein
MPGLGESAAQPVFSSLGSIGREIRSAGNRVGCNDRGRVGLSLARRVLPVRVEDAVMNPISIGPGVDMTGSLQFLALVALLVVFSGYALIFRAMRHASREQVRLRCPARLRTARVVFELAPDGSRTDVVRCSIFRGRPAITCGKVCLGATPAVQA